MAAHSTAREQQEKPAFLDTFTNRLRLEGRIVTRTGLHIGAGGSHDPLATDSPVVRNAAGMPYIPGSSLKGVVRSAAESLMRGAGQAGALWTCEFLAGQPCLEHLRVEEIRDIHRQNFGKQVQDKELREEDFELSVQRATTTDVWKESCTICRLFGSLALASRVRFPDLPLDGGRPMLEIRNGVGIERDRELAAAGVLYDFEAVPPETRFELTVILDNATDAEVGLVLYLFEQLDQGNLALGGKTSRGLGQVRVEWSSLRETRLDGDNPFAELLSSRDLLKSAESEPEGEPTQPSAPKIPTSGDAAAWKVLAEILEEMPRVDKSELGQKAGERGLSKTELNDRLALGFEGRKARKVWDNVLDRFVEYGFLVLQGDDYLLASAVPDPSEESGEEAAAGPDPALQKIYDRFIQAMAELWEEAA